MRCTQGWSLLNRIYFEILSQKWSQLGKTCRLTQPNKIFNKRVSKLSSPTTDEDEILPSQAGILAESRLELERTIKSLEITIVDRTMCYENAMKFLDSYKITINDNFLYFLKCRSSSRHILCSVINLNYNKL